MPIRVQAPNGATVEFPDGTDHGTIVKAITENFGSGGEPKPQREKTGALSAAAQGVGQGISFGLSDEIEGAVRGGVDALTSDKSFADAYGERRDAARERLSQASTDQPLAYYGGEIGSALVVPGGLARAGVRGLTARAAERGLGARSAAAAGEGAAYGAAYGFGTGQGGVEDHAQNMLTSAALGGAIGGAIPGVVDAGAAVARRVAQPFRGYVNPQGVASEKMAEALARDVGASGSPADIGAASERIGARAAAAADDPTMMLADLGGENTRRLVRQAGDMPNDNVNRLNKKLDHRQQFQHVRIERDMADALGNPNEYASSIDDIIARRSAAASDDFAEAMAVDVPMTDKLQGVLQRPAMQTLMKNVEASLQNEGQAVGRETRMQMIHRLKVELDNQIGTAKRAQAMGNDRTAGMDARTLTILKRDLLDAIESPAYQKALQNFAGESALANAAKEGFDDALKLPVEEIRQTLASLGQSEQEMWRLGASRALAGKIRQGNVMRDRTDNMFGSPDIQMRLRAIFPDARSLREFQRSLVREARKADTRKAVQGGSKTSQNLKTSDEAGAPARALQTAANLASGRVVEPVLAALGRAGNRFSGLNPASANAMLEIAMRPASQGMDPLVLNALMRAGAAPAQRAGISNRLAAGAAAATQGPGKPKRSQ
jgi:hypothetical protein